MKRILGTSRWMFAAALAIAIVGVGVVSAGALAAPGVITPVGVGTGGTAVNAGVDFNAPPSVSRDGRFVAFASDASNLVAGDATETTDVFVRDRVASTTTRVSAGTSRAGGNAASLAPSISADGRWVAFESLASNLVPNDTPGTWDVFVWDRLDGSITRVSDPSSGGARSPSISATGTLVAYTVPRPPNDQNGDVVVRDIGASVTTTVSADSNGAPGNRGGAFPAISADGLFVAFASGSSNLVSGDSNGFDDVFVRDLRAGTTEIVSIGSTGSKGDGNSVLPAISATGRFVGFDSQATNLVTGDTNDAIDVFVRDRVEGTTTRVNVDSTGEQGDAGDFSSLAAPSISATGGLVGFQSPATNLVPDDANGASDVFVRDMNAGTTTRVSGPVGSETGFGSSFPAMSGDGTYVAFFADPDPLADPEEFANAFISDWRRFESAVVLSTSSHSPLAYGGTFSIKGTLTSGTTDMSGQAVWLQTSSTFGGPYSDATSATATAGGAFLLKTKPKDKTYYRVRFNGSLTEAFAISAQTVDVTPKAYVTVSAPSTMYRGRSYKITGYVRPAHASGKYVADLLFYRKNSKGTYVYHHTVKVRRPASGTKYTATLSLSPRGKWCVRARHQDDLHARSYSSYDYITVK